MTKPSPEVAAARLAYNVAATAYWGIGILGVIVLFCTFHWVGKLFQWRRSHNAGTLTKSARLVRSVLMRRVPYVTTVGHGMLFSVYIAINVAVTVTLVKWDDSILTLIAKRLGWVATANLAFLTFLALKNTPLAFLTTQSYDRLNILHRFAGYTTIFAMAGHVAVYFADVYGSNSLYRFLQFDQIMGMVAGGAMLAMGVTAFFMRRMLYETFYIVHIVCYMLVLITLGMHRPDPEEDALWVVVFSAGLWIFDRLLRAGRIFWYAGDNSATVTPLPDGGMRVVLKRSSHRAVPGSHIFLWVPSIRAFESHPFTVASTNPIELVVKSQDGFTGDLLKKATEHPGVELAASMDGPYGSLPDYSLFDHIVFIAGGSGASFTFGIACGIVHKMGKERRPSISFHWVIRTPETLEWFATDLHSLRSSPLVNTTIHISAPTFAVSAPAPQIPPPAFNPTRHAFSQPVDQQSPLSRPVERQLSRHGSKHPYRGYDLDRDIEKQGLTDIIKSPDSSPYSRSRANFEKSTYSTESLVPARPAPSPPLALPPSPPWSDARPNPRSRTINRRPDIRKTVGEEIEMADRKLREDGKPNGRVLVVACGPGRMVGDVRASVASWVARGDGVGVELLVEGFGW